jgi:SAM-dependent methyltransferase
MKRLARLGRIIRQRIYPIPVLARRYVRRAGATFASGLPPGPVCLDIGGGVSPYRRALEEVLDVSLYVSLDVACSDQTTLVGDATRIPLADCSVGVVLCMEVLQHILDTTRVLEEMKRVLRPGGLMILSFPFVYAECDVVDFHRWSMLGMESELRRCGLEVVDGRRRGGFFFTGACLLQWCAQHLLPGARASWRTKPTAASVARAVVVQILTLPTVLVGWLALGLDALVPARGVYVGGLMVVRRPPLEA